MSLMCMYMIIFIRQPTLANLRRGTFYLVSNIDKTFYSVVYHILKTEYEKRFTWLFSMKRVITVNVNWIAVTPAIRLPVHLTFLK